MSVVVVTSDPVITVAQDNPAITAVVPVTNFPQTKTGVSISVPLAASTDFNTVLTPGFYYTIDALSANTPIVGHLWYLNVMVDGASQSTNLIQEAMTLDATIAPYLRQLVNGSWGSWQQNVLLDASGKLPAVDGSRLTNVSANVSSFILNYISGLTLSTAGASATFSVAKGSANDSTNSTTMVMASAISKTTGSWSAGSGNGSLDTGSIAPNTSYHVYLIENLNTSVVDVLTSLSVTPSLPISFTISRRIGSLLTDGSSHWTKFVQLGDRVLWDVAVVNVNATPGTTAIQTATVTTPPGVQTDALLNVIGVAGAGNDGRGGVWSPDANSAGSLPTSAIGLINFGILSSSAQQSASTLSVRTNTSSQVKFAMNSGSGQIILSTIGYIDQRGK